MFARSRIALLPPIKTRCCVPHERRPFQSHQLDQIQLPANDVLGGPRPSVLAFREASATIIQSRFIRSGPFVMSELNSFILFTLTPGADVTSDQLEACALLFSQNYGVWGPQASEVSKYLTPGARVKMSASKLKSQCLESPERTLLSTCYMGGKLVGHAFATTWDFEEGQIAWVTQLVVSKDYRQQGIATQLLRQLKRSDHTAFGLVSSHPAACKAVTKLARMRLPQIDLEFIRMHAATILQSTPIDYLKTAELRGSLFEQSPVDPSVVSSVFTKFYVDHAEPLAALKEYENEWPLGSLLDGHEFFIVVKVPLSLRPSLM